MQQFADTLERLQELVYQHLAVIYPELDLHTLTQQVIDRIGVRGGCEQPIPFHNPWSEQDTFVITYGNSIISGAEPPLKTLRQMLDDEFKEMISGVHILPFYPYSSDDGFSVIDYKAVNPEFGDWCDIEDIAKDYKVMADFVLNHCSAQSEWFQNFLDDKSPGKDYFKVAHHDDDLTDVVRPRESALLHPVETANGLRHVWCTFSHDQVDLDFGNPNVLLEFVSILRFYLDRGIQVFRLDAVAFLWKVPGTTSLNLPETHEIVRLLRTLLEHVDPNAILITETNIPNRENLEYFGNGNEAHMVYNFPLPPLLVNTLVSGNCNALKTWIMSMPPALPGTTYFNFIASHDGIGLRPAEGILSDDEIQTFVDAMLEFGGQVSWRALEGDKRKPYEVNISLFDALKGTVKGEDDLAVERFVCAHTVMLGLEGVPAFYIHSLVATRSDVEKMERLGYPRAINRHNWDLQQLEDLLEDQDTHHAQVYNRLKTLIRIRRAQPAFHPNATQFTLQTGSAIFSVWRQSQDRRQSIFCVTNITDVEQPFSLSQLNLINTENWLDLISGNTLDDLVGDCTMKPYQTLWLTNRK